MSTTFEGNSAMLRAIENPLVHYLFYGSIILWEALALGLIVWGTWIMWQQRSASAADFRKATQIACVGLIVSLLQWYVAFISVGGEWFLMWQSDTWNGQEAAQRMFVIMGISLLFLNQKEGGEFA